jgi:hypothetical protein
MPPSVLPALDRPCELSMERHQLAPEVSETEPPTRAPGPRDGEVVAVGAPDRCSVAGEPVGLVAVVAGAFVARREIGVQRGE